jgi:uncharacterized protein Gcw-chp
VLPLLLARLADAQSLGGSLGVGTDDVFRGLSQSDGQISPQGDLHAVLGPWYGGVSAEEVRRGVDQRASAELIAYAGYQQRLAEDWTGRVTLRHYDYPGDGLHGRYDYDELALSLAWRERLIVTAVASPDTYFRDYDGNYGSGPAWLLRPAASDRYRLHLLERRRESPLGRLGGGPALCRHRRCRAAPFRGSRRRSRGAERILAVLSAVTRWTGREFCRADTTFQRPCGHSLARHMLPAKGPIR